MTLPDPSTEIVDNFPLPSLSIARECLPFLAKGQALPTQFLSDSMTRYYGGDDASGAWNWKQAYDAVECAMILFVQKYRVALAKQDNARLLASFERLHGFCPTHTKRSEQSLRGLKHTKHIFCFHS